LEVYPILQRGAVSGLRPGIYHFRPRARDLEWLGPHRRSSSLFVQAAGAAMETLPETPPIVLAITSRVPELARQYPDALAYALVMREVGCLLQTCSLVAVSLKLGSCLLGRGLPTRFLTAATGIPWQTEALVGELALGIPKSELTAPRKRSPGRARPAR
jgi:SagB-type dehydrogenase family enzyme